MKTLIHQRVELARHGDNPTVIAKVRSGWVVLGDVQFLKGYSLLLPDPVVPSLNDLAGSKRQIYLDDMVALGDALLEVTDAARINYEILGNTEEALHAHLFPRYRDEDEKLRAGPAWFYDWKNCEEFDTNSHKSLMAQIYVALSKRVSCESV
jgi:diadenosine tetraphosphate (Ap4A) HIT family hydrolase